MKTSREQFEEWASQHYICISKLGGEGSYDSEPVQIAWEGWQASRQCIEVEPPELLTTPAKQFKFERDCQWKEAISKTGIKVKGA